MVLGFLSPTWYISSHGMFAGSCIGVICLVMALEFLRRVQREYNRSINRTKDDDGDTTTLIAGSTSNSSIDDHGCRKGPDVNIAATRSPRGQGSQIPRQQMNRMTLLRRQFIRAVMHMLQFGVAYIIMLIAMSFNGKRTWETGRPLETLMFESRIHHYIHTYWRFPWFVHF